MSDVELNNKISPALDQRQYVTFRLGDELYGVNVMKAQEVMGMVPLGHVPDTQPYMKGVIDLRGTIVPVVDLRMKYGMEEKVYDDDTAIMIVEMHSQLVGTIVDSVMDVLQISFEDVQDTPHFTAKMDKDSVQGIGKVNDRIIIILDAEKILSEEEMKGIEQNSSYAADRSYIF